MRLERWIAGSYAPEIELSTMKAKTPVIAVLGRREVRSRLETGGFRLRTVRSLQEIGQGPDKDLPRLIVIEHVARKGNGKKTVNENLRPAVEEVEEAYLTSVLRDNQGAIEISAKQAFGCGLSGYR